MSHPPIARLLATALVALQLVLQPLAAFGSCGTVASGPDCCCRSARAEVASPTEDRGPRSSCCGSGHRAEEGPPGEDATAGLSGRCDCRLTPRERPQDDAIEPLSSDRLVGPAVSTGPALRFWGAPRLGSKAVGGRAPVPRGPTPLHVLYQAFLL